MKFTKVGFGVSEPLVAAISFLLAAMLIVAAISKLYYYQDTVTTVSQLHILPSFLISRIPSILAVAELTIAFSLLFFPRHPVTFSASGLLFSLFLTYHIFRVWAGIHVPCTCFGLFLKIHPGAGVLMNLVAVLLSTTVLPTAAFFQKGRC